MFTIDRIKKTLSDASFLILSRIFTINTICRIKRSTSVRRFLNLANPASSCKSCSDVHDVHDEENVHREGNLLNAKQDFHD